MALLARRFAVTLVLMLAIASSVIAADRQLHTYSMQRALPEQVLPALQPLLSDGSSAQAFQNQLILNVTADEYRTALNLLRQIDVAARSLLISVRKNADSQSNQSQYGIDGRIGSGNVQARTDDSRSSRTEIYGSNNTRSSQRDGSQQVRAVEGTPAFISAGTTQAVTTRTSPYGSTRELIPVESGFYATARVIDNEVIIDIDQRDDRVQGRTIQTQGIQTQVRGRVGEWISLGALNTAEHNAGSGITSTGRAAQFERGDIALKVELSP